VVRWLNGAIRATDLCCSPPAHLIKNGDWRSRVALRGWHARRRGQLDASSSTGFEVGRLRGHSRGRCRLKWKHPPPRLRKRRLSC